MRAGQNFPILPIHESFFLEYQLQVLPQIGFRVRSGRVALIKRIRIFPHVHVQFLFENFRQSKSAKWKTKQIKDKQKNFGNCEITCEQWALDRSWGWCNAAPTLETARAGPSLHLFEQALNLPSIAFNCATPNQTFKKSAKFLQFRLDWQNFQFIIGDNVNAAVTDIEFNFFKVDLGYKN